MEDDLYLNGLWDLPFLSKASDMLKQGFLGFVRNPLAKELMA